MSLTSYQLSVLRSLVCLVGGSTKGIKLIVSVKKLQETLCFLASLAGSMRGIASCSWF